MNTINATINDQFGNIISLEQLKTVNPPLYKKLIRIFYFMSALGTKLRKIKYACNQLRGRRPDRNRLDKIKSKIKKVINLFDKMQRSLRNCPKHIDYEHSKKYGELVELHKCLERTYEYMTNNIVYRIEIRLLDATNLEDKLKNLLIALHGDYGSFMFGGNLNGQNAMEPTVVYSLNGLDLTLLLVAPKGTSQNTINNIVKNKLGGRVTAIENATGEEITKLSEHGVGVVNADGLFGRPDDGAPMPRPPLQRQPMSRFQQQDDIPLADILIREAKRDIAAEEKQAKKRPNNRAPVPRPPLQIKPIGKRPDDGAPNNVGHERRTRRKIQEDEVPLYEQELNPELERELFGFSDTLKQHILKDQTIQPPWRAGEKKGPTIQPPWHAGEKKGPTISLGGSRVNYYEKYLTYKTKYLELKKQY